MRVRAAASSSASGSPSSRRQISPIALERVGVQLEVAPHRARPLDEQADGGGLRQLLCRLGSRRKAERLDLVHRLSRHGEALAARREHANPRTGREECEHELGRGSGEVLAVVQDEQQLAPPQVALEEDERRGRLTLELRRPHAERLHDHLRDARGLSVRGELDEPDPVRVLLRERASRLRGEARLPHSARAGEGDNPVLGEAGDDISAILLAPHEAREPGSDVRLQRLRARERGCALEHLPLEPTRVLVRLEAELSEPLGELSIRTRARPPGARSDRARA